MTHDYASITIAGRSLELPLYHLHQLLSDLASSPCEAKFRREQILRRTTTALGKAHPDRCREFRLKGGSIWLGIAGDHWRCRTLAEVLITAMRWLHEYRDDALLPLASRRKYSRAYIATNPVALYGGRKDLAVHARQFAPGWYVDTNLSASNTKRFLADAFAEAGLDPGRDWYFGFLR
jgi:hypothetical protein